MPDHLNRTTEFEISRVVLSILASRPNGSASVGELVSEIPRYLNLTRTDLDQSESRPNEANWEQRVRNITSHKGTPGNYIYEGFLKPIPGGLCITEAGRLRNQRR